MADCCARLGQKASEPAMPAIEEIVASPLLKVCLTRTALPIYRFTGAKRLSQRWGNSSAAFSVPNLRFAIPSILVAHIHNQFHSRRPSCLSILQYRASKKKPRAKLQLRQLASRSGEPGPITPAGHHPSWPILWIWDYDE